MDFIKIVVEIIQTLGAIIIVGMGSRMAWDDYIKPRYKFWKEREERMMKRLS